VLIAADATPVMSVLEVVKVAAHRRARARDLAT
jgi:hypothetical protein